MERNGRNAPDEGVLAGAVVVLVHEIPVDAHARRGQVALVSPNLSATKLTPAVSGARP